MNNAPEISVIIPCHKEGNELRRAILSVFKQIEAPSYELIVVADRAEQSTMTIAAAAFMSAPEGVGVRMLDVDNGDLGLTRNAGIAAARGKHIALLDGDDLFGAKWLQQANAHARRFGDENWALHTAWMVMFGAQSFIHRCFAENDPEFDAKDMIQYNPWSALAYAPRSLFLKYAQEEASKGNQFEDWMWATLTLGAGVRHECVADSCHMIRMKHDETSLAYRATQKRGALKSRPLFDRRDLPKAERVATPQQQMPEEVFRQVLFAHHEVGERLLLLNGQEECRLYPTAKIWDDQAWLRDEIGASKNVVLVNELLRGGAEKYAIEYCKTLGGDVVIIETQPGKSPWLAEARKHAKVVQWFRRNILTPPEQALAIQRAIIQAELDTLAVFNSQIGWALVHENSQVLAKKVIAASFATIPLPMGFTSCPPFHLKGEHPTLTLLTDNERHAAKMRDYCNLNPSQVVVVPPRVTYSGESKRSSLTKKHLRILWAGRGSAEKCPEAVVYVAMAMRDEADFHVFGDVQQVPHALDNLKYRGPFEGFESIDGTFDAYLMTSIQEGCPNTALEAILADLPVVASDVGDLKKLSCVVYQANTDPQRMAANAVAALRAFMKTGSDFDVAKPKVIAQGYAASFDASIKALVAV